MNYKISEKLNDSLTLDKLIDDLDYKDSITNPLPRYIVCKYGDIFKNNHKYLILKDQGIGDSYIWFKKNKKGFVKFFERDISDPSYIKDSIFDTNKDGKNELIIYKHSGGTTGDYKRTYFLNNNGLIKNEYIVELKNGTKIVEYVR